MIVIACKYPDSRHLICRYRFNHVKNSIWLDTLKKVLKTCFPLLQIKWNNVDYYITFPNGSELWIGGLDDKERSEKILGMEFLTVFVNEASQISYDAFTTLLTRLAQLIPGAKNRLFVDMNPPSKKHWSYKLWIEGLEPDDNTKLSKTVVDEYGALKMNPADNLENISDTYIALLESMPERKKKRFLRGEFGDDSEGALWDDDMISVNRVHECPPLRRIVVAIDPAVTNKDTSDETGIIVGGVGFDDHFYVLEDVTDTYTPTQWAQAAIRMYKKWEADRVVAEVNQGGDMVEAIIHGIDKTIPYSSVFATRNKLTRAEPVAALWEQGRAHHVGTHVDLELEQTSWESKNGEKSPNRIDALVWCAFELALTEQYEYSII